VLQELAKVHWKDISPIVAGFKHYIELEKRPRGRLTLPKRLEPLGPAHKRYLRDRGFTPEALERLWQLQGIGPVGRLMWRVFIPIHLRGELVSWTTRTIGNGELRYVSASPEEESFSHKDILYGADRASSTIIVVEGPADVWAFGPGAVATLGVVVSRAQFLEMSAYPVRYICFDSSREAQKRAGELATRLKAFKGETYQVELESGDDPGSADPDEIREVRKLAGLNSVWER